MAKFVHINKNSAQYTCSPVPFNLNPPSVGNGPLGGMSDHSCSLWGSQAGGGTVISVDDDREK